jgi:deoxyinosine 3'endonuclease (endonuclease V)
VVILKKPSIGFAKKAFLRLQKKQAELPQKEQLLLTFTEKAESAFL